MTCQLFNTLSAVEMFCDSALYRTNLRLALATILLICVRTRRYKYVAQRRNASGGIHEHYPRHFGSRLRADIRRLAQHLHRTYNGNI